MKLIKYLSLVVGIFVFVSLYLYVTGFSRNTSQITDTSLTIGSCREEILEELYAEKNYGYILGESPNTVFHFVNHELDEVRASVQLLSSPTWEVSNSATKLFLGIRHLRAYTIFFENDCIVRIEERFHFVNV